MKNGFFYNFNEDIQNITFTIKFEIIENKIERLFHNKRNNYHLILNPLTAENKILNFYAKSTWFYQPFIIPVTFFSETHSF